MLVKKMMKISFLLIKELIRNGYKIGIIRFLTQLYSATNHKKW